MAKARDSFLSQKAKAWWYVEEPEAIKKTFEHNYIDLLGSSSVVQGVHVPTIELGSLVIDSHINILDSVVTNNEVKAAIFEIHGTKAFGPNSYSSQFFKAS
ncbi:hypothetical protein vseg_001877 [Gypsophila vaccaria]